MVVAVVVVVVVVGDGGGGKRVRAYQSITLIFFLCYRIIYLPFPSIMNYPNERPVWHISTFV